jgi:L-gulono-1,4-lactone dehydrogenase
MKASPDHRVWRNWAGTATAAPARWCRPRSEAEISAAVKDAVAAGLPVRALGSGHSFTAAAATSGVALDLSGWTGITAADTGTGLVTVRSGTTLRALNAELGGLGLAMANLGDIDAQTLAGALSTGTHGTGARLGGLATQVEALELVLADGSVVTCSASSRPELFAAARVSLGALGVITAVTLRCVPSFTLLADERPVPVEEVLEQSASWPRPTITSSSTGSPTAARPWSSGTTGCPRRTRRPGSRRRCRAGGGSGSSR